MSKPLSQDRHEDLSILFQEDAQSVNMRCSRIVAIRIERLRRTVSGTLSVKLCPLPKRGYSFDCSFDHFVSAPSITALAQATCPLGEWCVSHGAHDEAADHPPEGL